MAIISSTTTISAEREGREYIEDGEIRVILQDGEYAGWYRP